MRLFVSVPIPESVAGAFEDVRRQVRRRLPGVRWEDPGKYHLTLKFLGEMDPAAERQVRSALKICLDPVPGFHAELCGLGAFPTEKAPRVIWIGLREGRQALKALAGRVDAALEATGIVKDERPFQAHLTLGRLKFAPRLKEAPWPADWAERGFGRFQTDKVRLMQSRLTPEGAIHSIVEEYPLRPAP